MASSMVEFWTRHGNHLGMVQGLNDATYLEEPFGNARRTGCRTRDRTWRIPSPSIRSTSWGQAARLGAQLSDGDRSPRSRGPVQERIDNIRGREVNRITVTRRQRCVPPCSQPSSPSPPFRTEMVLVAIRRMRARRSASMPGLPGRRRDRRLQHSPALHDASGRQLPVAPAQARSSTQATSVASIPRTVGPMGESVDPNDQGPPADGAGQDTQREGLDEQIERSESPRSCERRRAPAVEWPSATRVSTILLGPDFGEHT